MKLFNFIYFKTVLRMTILSVVTITIAVVANQFIEKGIRLPILVKSIPYLFVRECPSISQEEALLLLKSDKAIFVDLRSEYEFDMDHIKDAISLPVGDFLSNPKLVRDYDGDKSLTTILYGSKSIADNINILAYFLKSDGINKVMFLEDGFDKWLENEYPVGF